MKTRHSEKEVPVPIEDRDFIKEYYELMQKFGIDIDQVNHQWHENNGHIKKFSLLEKSPTPILTDNTLLINH